MTTTTLTSTNPLLRFLAQVVSYVLHPLFIPTYIFLLLMTLFPYEFAGISPWQLKLRLFSVFWMTAFFPAFAVFLLWRLKFSESIFLRTQKERIIPYIITMFFYWWMHYLSRNFADQPQVLQFFYTGIFMATSVGLIANNFYKISLHGIGMGGTSMAVVLFAFYYHQPLGIPITGALLLTGIVASSRLYISDHSQKEVYMGLLVGALCQAAAYFFVM
jgi:hypothetical protein